jgi:hypothetical protein
LRRNIHPAASLAPLEQAKFLIGILTRLERVEAPALALQTGSAEPACANLVRAR